MKVGAPALMVRQVLQQEVEAVRWREDARTAVPRTERKESSLGGDQPVRGSQVKTVVRKNNKIPSYPRQRMMKRGAVRWRPTRNYQVRMSLNPAVLEA